MPKQGANGITWTDYSWPVINGCRSVSEGCRNCYASRLAATRLKHTPRHRGLAVMKNSGPQWTGRTRFIEKELLVPLRTRKPSKFFVCNLGDLFYERVPTKWIDRVFAVMLLCPQHTFQVLTKRAHRMHDYIWDPDTYARVLREAERIRRKLPQRHAAHAVTISNPSHGSASWIWLGVSVEDQATADERLSWLRDTPAAVRFVSYEPALGPVRFQFACDDCARRAFAECPRRIHWLICGGESGPGARPFDVEWARSAIEQCKASGVAYFGKQLGARPRELASGTDLHATWDAPIRDRKGATMSEWPRDLRVREMPRPR